MYGSIDFLREYYILQLAQHILSSLFGGVAATLLVQGGVIGWLLLVGLSVATGIKAGQIKQQRLKEEVAESVEMVPITGGTFMMGSAQDDGQVYEWEHPQRQVTVSDFFMARYPMTRKQYREVMEQRLRGWKWYELHPRLPANYVRWLDAVQFCNALSEQQGLQSCYRFIGEHVIWDEEANGYRLPTEAEWEYAARAGTTTGWFCGNEATELEHYAWFGEDITARPHSVGQKGPIPGGSTIWQGMCGNGAGSYSVRDLKAFQIALPLYRKLCEELREAHPAAQALCGYYYPTPADVKSTQQRTREACPAEIYLRWTSRTGLKTCQHRVIHKIF